MEKIKILSIKCSSTGGNLDKNEFEWINDDKKKINVFFMGNGSGKTLIFSSINYMLAGEYKDHIDDQYQDINITVEVLIGKEKYKLIRTHKKINIYLDDKEVSLEKYKETVRKKLNIGHDLSLINNNSTRKNTKKNTLSSIFRYNFFSDHDVYRKSKGAQYKIGLINNSYDGSAKKILFAYFLGSDFSQEDFSKASKYYFIDNYLSEKKSMVKKYEDIDNLFDDNKESDLYIEYSCIKQNLGDISVAISKLEELCKVAINLLGKESEDFKFLISEKNKLIKIKKNIETNKNKLKIQINSLSKIEKEKLLNVSDPKITSTIKRYRKYADEIDNMKESISDILKIINEKLSAFYSFFVPKIKTIPIFSGYQVDFDVSKQEISVKSGVSEGQIILLRIISSIFTNVFSQQYKGKISNVAFYDSTFEPIDEDSGKELFDILNNLYSDETIKKYLPQLFIFIVGKKDLFGLQKMNNIKYSNKGFLS